MGFPQHLVYLIKKLYSNQKATARAAYGFADFFNIGQGFRQGCILFNIYSEKIMRNSLEGFEGSAKIGGKTVANLRYADDIVLIAGSMKELETLVINGNLASEQA